jgi:hypothetical protein
MKWVKIAQQGGHFEASPRHQESLNPAEREKESVPAHCETSEADNEHTLAFPHAKGAGEI